MGSTSYITNLDGLTGSDVTTSASLILGGSHCTSVKTDSMGVPILKNGHQVTI